MRSVLRCLSVLAFTLVFTLAALAEEKKPAEKKPAPKPGQVATTKPAPTPGAAEPKPASPQYAAAKPLPPATDGAPKSGGDATLLSSQPTAPTGSVDSRWTNGR